MDSRRRRPTSTQDGAADITDAAKREAASAAFNLLSSAGPNLDLSPEQFRLVSKLVHDHSGIHLQDGKQSLVSARVAKRVRARGLESISAYLDVLAKDKSGEEFECLIDAISTNLTSFFRENSHFEFLRTRLLPNLAKSRGGAGRVRLRGWSAACSTGEEPYTLAMTVLDVLGDAAAADTRLLATDICHTVLKKARAGRYAADRVANIPAPMRERFLERIAGETSEYDVRPAVKAMVKFNHLNLMESWPFQGPFDFVFCRNVMIYFDKPTQEKLVNRIHGVLAPGGVLFTGHSESLTGITHGLRYLEPTIYERP
jgi:chemotaxis protein methyltransferase CheR